MRRFWLSYPEPNQALERTATAQAVWRSLVRCLWAAARRQRCTHRLAAGNDRSTMCQSTRRLCTLSCPGSRMAHVTLQDLFQAGFPDYERRHPLPWHVRQAARAMMQCRTGRVVG
jgi:hypothetical protein